MMSQNNMLYTIQTTCNQNCTNHSKELIKLTKDTTDKLDVLNNRFTETLSDH